jgi:hypothetical protein
MSSALPPRSLAPCFERAPRASRCMASYPHQCTASASAFPEGNVSLESPGLPALSTLPPAPFGGPGDQWSPESGPRLQTS